MASGCQGLLRKGYGWQRLVTSFKFVGIKRGNFEFNYA